MDICQLNPDQANTDKYDYVKSVTTNILDTNNDNQHTKMFSVPHNVLAHNVLAFSIWVRVVSNMCTTQDYRESGKKKKI